MKPLTDRGARAALRRLKAQSAAGEAIHSYKDVADLVDWAERILARRLKRRRR